MEMIFSKRETDITKGVAVILLLFHHVCETYFRETYQLTNFVFPMSYTINISTIGKVCVHMFIFLTAFGICRKFVGGVRKICD